MANYSYLKKNIMKKIILFAVVLITLASCKKSSSGNITTTNTISATVWGDDLTFNTDIYSESEFDNSAPPYSPYFYAEAYDSLGNYMYVEFGADSANVLTPKVYGKPGDSTTYGYLYFQIQGGAWYETTPYSATVSVASVGSAMQGTFKGWVYQYGNPTNDSIYISNGKFNMYQ
jgi:hypothetical protein